MALYRYNARDRENRKYKGVKEAGSEAELVKALLEDGLYCCSLKNEERTASMKHFTVPLKLLPPLCSQVSSMLAAGVPQAEILKTACKTAANREMKALLGELEEKVHKGQTLFEAMESMHGCFPKLLVYMVQTGETSGTLDHILEKMSSYYEKEVEMAGKVRTAMIYPCILFFASIGASAFLLTSVLPQFRVMLAEYELPAITRFMMKAGAYLQDNWLLYVCFLPLLLLFMMALFAVPWLRLRRDQMILYIPVIGIDLCDDLANQVYPMPTSFIGDELTHVGRVRKDLYKDNALSLWITGDQLMKGAAYNSVDIGLKMIELGLLK